MNKLSRKHMHMEAFLATPHHVLLRYGLMLALPLVVLWLIATLPLYGLGPELPRIVGSAVLIVLLSGAGASLIKLQYRIMSFPGVEHTLPVNYAAASLGFAMLLVIMSGTEPQFLAMGRLIQVTVLAAPALVFIPALLYAMGYSLIIHRILMRNTNLDFNYLVGSRHLEEQLAALWERPKEFGEPLSLMLLQFRPQEQAISPTAPNVTSYYPEIVEKALPIVDQIIRKNDVADQFSSDAIWVILGRTGADSVDIPRNRIRSRLQGDAEFAAAIKRVGLEVVPGVASYRRDMDSPKHLIHAAEEALAPQAARLK
ncbi:MAG: hypothetical protein EA428_13310 [Spirochaetaceae bacterium]|nr:MAG: hypothetical protein EA428_13310 [Spirochaetaceae bacterium]